MGCTAPPRKSSRDSESKCEGTGERRSGHEVPEEARQGVGVAPLIVEKRDTEGQAESDKLTHNEPTENGREPEPAK